MDYCVKKTKCATGEDVYVLYTVVDVIDVDERPVRIKRKIGIVSLEELQKQLIDIQAKIDAIKSLEK